MWYRHTMEFYLVIKKTEIMTFVKKGHGTGNDYIKARQLRTTMMSSFLSYAEDRFRFLHMCTYVCVDWGLHESEARKRAVRGWKEGWVGKRGNKAVDSM